MLKLNLKKISFLVVVLSLGFVLIFSLKSRAEDAPADTTDNYILRKVWKADELIKSDTLKKFSEPRRIVFVENPPLSKNKNSAKHIKELYYFFAFKMGLGDMPIHLIEDESGKVYEGKSLGTDSVLPITGYEKGDVVVAYIGAQTLSENKDKFVEGYKKTLALTGVDPSKTIVKKINLDLDLINKQSKISIIDSPETDFSKTFIAINSDIAKTWEKQKREYGLEVTKTNYEKAPKVGTQADIQVEVKNTGNYNIYFDGESELFAVTDEKFDHESKLYIDKSWATKSRTPIMSEDNSILPVGKTIIFTFKANVPLESGEIAEKFILVNKRGDKFDKSKFEVKFNLDLSGKKIVEVKDNEYGFLKVRKEPRSGADELTRILPGERYEWMVRDDNGYISIKLTDGTVGYVVGTYVKIVQ